MQPIFVVQSDSYSQNKSVVILMHLMLLFRCFLDFEDGTLWAFIGPIIPVFLVSTPISSAVVGMFFPYRHVEIIGSRRRHACRHNSSFE